MTIVAKCFSHNTKCHTILWCYDFLGGITVEEDIMSVIELNWDFHVIACKGRSEIMH
jgi:hypothetical protein